MGIFDKVKATSMDLVEKTQNAVDNKMEERELLKEKKDIVNSENQKLLDLFKATHDMGDISIDMNNRLFKVKHATGKIKKKGSVLGKATAAYLTLGASVAIEQALKPDDRVFEFDILEGYELIEDDSLVTSGGTAKALAGGLLFGGFGAIAGGVTGKRKQKKSVESLVLQINTSDMDFPCIMIPYISREAKVTSSTYKNAYSLAKQSMQCIDIIIKDEDSRQSETPEPASTVQEQATVPNDIASQIMKFKELLDMGAITQEEFDTKKKELLGL